MWVISSSSFVCQNGASGRRRSLARLSLIFAVLIPVCLGDPQRSTKRFLDAAHAFGATCHRGPVSR